MAEQKRAFLVVGPESCGNHLVTEILIAAGCIGDTGQQNSFETDPGPPDQRPQRWDTETPTDQDPIVWLRSMPHGGQWPDLDGILRALQEHGYAVTGVVTVRDWHGAVRSQVERTHVKRPSVAKGHLRIAYQNIFGPFAELSVPYIVTTYEALVNVPGAQAWLCEELGLKPGPWVRTWNANGRHYAREGREG